MTAIQVATSPGYRVTIGSHVSAGIDGLLDPGVRVAIIVPTSLSRLAARLADGLSEWPTHVLEVPDGEAQKTAKVLDSCWKQLAAIGFTRDDYVLGLGGGATTDLAGFVAATWLRGVRYIALPTSTLGMVDAAVGGKTGINLPAGKNLVGAFYEPQAVIADLDYLQTCPAAEHRSGMAEVLKCGFIADPQILNLLGKSADEALDTNSDICAELITRAVAVKAGVVAKDLRESASAETGIGREALNYGHTLAHAIEQQSEYMWRHGEAVSVGMVFAAELANSVVGLDQDLVDKHAELAAALQLPTVATGFEWAGLREAMSLDKKSRGANLRFVLLTGEQRPGIVTDIPETALERAFAKVS